MFLVFFLSDWACKWACKNEYRKCTVQLRRSRSVSKEHRLTIVLKHFNVALCAMCSCYSLCLIGCGNGRAKTSTENAFLDKKVKICFKGA